MLRQGTMSWQVRQDDVRFEAKSVLACHRQMKNKQHSCAPVDFLGKMMNTP